MKTFSVLISAMIVLAIASPLARANEVVSSLEEANAFCEDITPRKASLEVAGKVLSVYLSPVSAEIILENNKGVRTVLFSDRTSLLPSPGDTITATGTAYMSEDHESFLKITDFKVLARGQRPEPITMKLSETNPKTNHLMTIRTVGTVLDVLADELDRRYQILLLKDEGVVLPAVIHIETIGDCRKLIGATIRITGIYHRTVGGERKFSLPNITPLSREDIESISPPPSDPFSVPLLEERLYLQPEDIIRMSSRSASGEVLATWSDNRVMLRTDSGQIVNLKLLNGMKLPRCGETIIVAGQPETDLIRINLSSARWKSSASPKIKKNEQPETCTASTLWWDSERTAIESKSHGRLITATGIVRTLPVRGDRDLRFILDAGDFSIPIDVTTNPSVLDELEIGCSIRATGRCMLLTDDRQRENIFPQAKGFALVIRSPDDIFILRHAPWLTTKRLLIIAAILLSVLFIAGARLIIQNHLARQKIAERTRLAVELHDSLSQNLAGVACQIAAGDNTFDEDPDTARKCIKNAVKMLLSCRAELKNCLFDLRSDMLEEENFAGAVTKALGPLVHETALSIRFNVRRRVFPDAAAHSILSIIRELAANAIRHGHASHVKIAGCTNNGKLLFSVTDNGSGFDTANCAGITEGHFGITGIRDRLKRLGGEILFSSTPGKGTSVTITVPIPKS